MQPGDRESSDANWKSFTLVSGVGRLSWLRQQQLKLAARRDERNPGKLWRQETGNRVIGELRSLQRGRLRHDGYASDSAVLDDDDETWAPHSVSGQVRHSNFTARIINRTIFYVETSRKRCSSLKTSSKSNTFKLIESIATHLLTRVQRERTR